MAFDSSLDSFKALISSRGGLARTNRFEIEMREPAGLGTQRSIDLSLLCETCTMPSRQIETTSFSPWRNAVKIPTGYVDEDVTFTFRLTNDYYVKEVFDKWLNSIVSGETYLAAYGEAYKTDVNIWQLNTTGERAYGVKLIEAYPVSINSINLDFNSDSTTQQVTAVFTYKTFETIDITAGAPRATVVTDGALRAKVITDNALKANVVTDGALRAKVVTFQGDINTNSPFLS